MGRDLGGRGRRLRQRTGRGFAARAGQACRCGSQPLDPFPDEGSVPLQRPHRPASDHDPVLRTELRKFLPQPALVVARRQRRQTYRGTRLFLLDDGARQYVESGQLRRRLLRHRVQAVRLSRQRELRRGPRHVRGRGLSGRPGGHSPGRLDQAGERERHFLRIDECTGPRRTDPHARATHSLLRTGPRLRCHMGKRGRRRCSRAGRLQPGSDRYGHRARRAPDRLSGLHFLRYRAAGPVGRRPRLRRSAESGLRGIRAQPDRRAGARSAIQSGRLYFVLSAAQQPDRGREPSRREFLLLSV